MELERIGSQRRAVRSRSGRPPPLVPRSHSTGHSLATRLDGDLERFTLRLPEHVRREMVAAGEESRFTQRARRGSDGGQRRQRSRVGGVEPACAWRRGRGGEPRRRRRARREAAEAPSSSALLRRSSPDPSPPLPSHRRRIEQREFAFEERGCVYLHLLSPTKAVCVACCLRCWRGCRERTVLTGDAFCFCLHRCLAC